MQKLHFAFNKHVWKFKYELGFCAFKYLKTSHVVFLDVLLFFKQSHRNKAFPKQFLNVTSFVNYPLPKREKKIYIFQIG